MLNLDLELLDRVLLSVRGLRCARVRLAEGGTLVLFLGTVSSDDASLTEWRLWIDCAWRYQCGVADAVASLDDGHAILAEIRSLEGALLRSCERDSLGRDLVLRFDKKMELKVFAHSTLDEAWEWRKADGYRVGLGPGLRLFEKVEARD